MDREKETAIVRDYAAGVPVLEIVARHHVSTETICKLVRGHNVPMRGWGAKRRRPIIYTKVQERMEKDRLTYVDLGRMTWHTPKTIGYALTGRMPLTKKVANDIAKALGYEHYTDLFGDVFTKRGSGGEHEAADKG